MHRPEQVFLVIHCRKKQTT